jgi:glycosyltransferase involved in cell wall biosynthesis
VRRAAAGPRKVRDNIWVASPMVLPLPRYGTVRTLNRTLLAATLRRHMRRLRMRRPMLWTYNPMTTQLLDVRRFQQVIYHCVDDIAAQPGMPADALERAEHDLLLSAHLVFATAPRLAERCARVNANTHYLPNVADYQHFSRALDPQLEVPADLAAIPAPRVGFVGAISSYKVDFTLLRTVAERHPEWSVVLIGKVGEGDPWTDAARLSGLPNLHLLGARPYPQLPAYLKGLDVALLPNVLNEYTASMFPMKFFEYLAAGRPIVSVDLPALQSYRNVVAVAASPDEFEARIAATLRGDAPPLNARLELARAHTYEARTERMLALIAGSRENAASSATIPGEKAA